MKRPLSTRTQMLIRSLCIAYILAVLLLPQGSASGAHLCNDEARHPAQASQAAPALDSLLAEAGEADQQQGVVSQHTRRVAIWLALGAVLAIPAGVWLFNRARRQEQTMQKVSLTYSLLCLGAIVLIAYLFVHRGLHDESSPRQKVVESAQDAQIFLDRITRKENGLPVFLPAGVLVQSIEFSQSYDVKVNGYLWEKHADNSPERVDIGILLPEGDVIEGTLAYTRTNTGNQVSGWYFATTLRQPIHYQDYPFDQQEIWLRLWPKDFDGDVILTPDFESYRVEDPQMHIGLENNLVLERWKIIGSFFSYRLNSYTTNFGIEDYIGQENFPELYFNVALRREYADALLTYLIAPVLVILLAYGALLLVRDPEQSDARSEHTLARLSYYAALLFIVVTFQAILRHDLNSVAVTYLDYYYFAAYLGLFLASLDMIAPRLGILPHSDTARLYRYPRLLFLPVLLTLLLVATAVSFY